VAWLFAVWPPPFWYRAHFPGNTAFMQMRGSIGRYRPVPLDSIAPAMAVAAMTGEDAKFWEHDGIDYEAILKALGYRRGDFDWNDPRDRVALRKALGRAWDRRDALRGASTITQQLAKNLYLSPSRNPLRKVKEAVTAWRLERALGKRRILELYLNVAEMGPGIWGAPAASEAYFRKPARRLNRSEAAALAGLLPFPLRSNPALKPGRMRWRQNLILRRMAGESLEVPKTDAEIPAQVDADTAPVDTDTTP
jgi:monofunctional biosynthetic peptidoglycan transglycosylase